MFMQQFREKPFMINGIKSQIQCIYLHVMPHGDSGTRNYHYHDYIELLYAIKANAEQHSQKVIVATSIEEIKPYEEELKAHKRIGVVVQTTQMCFLSTKLFKEGFDFIIIFGTGKNIFISIDDDGQIYCPDIQYKLTKNHNLFKLWQRGEFK